MIYFLVHFGNLVYFFFNLFFNGRKIAVQCCFGVCHTTMWNSHSINISPPCWASVPPTPLYPTPLGHHRSLGWAPVLYSSFPLAIYFAHGSVYMWVLLFQFVSCHVHKSIIYVCIKVQFLIKVHCKSTKMRNFPYSYCFLFDTAYKGKISIFNFYLLECMILWFNTCRHCEMIVTIKLIITSIISHSYHFFSVWWEYSWSTLSANIKHTVRC